MVKKKLDILEWLLIIGILVSMNVILSKHFFRVDFTEDKRYSITPVTQEALKQVDQDLYIQIFLDGELNPAYDRLKKSIKEKIEQLQAYSDVEIKYSFLDPNQNADKRVRDQVYRELIQKGIQPKYYLDEKNGQKTEKYIFPGALMFYKNREVAIPFLKGNKMASEEEQLNQSVEGVEFELLKGIKKLTESTFKSVAVISGQGEPSKEHLIEFTNALNEFYNVERVPLKSDTSLNRFELVILAAPTKYFTDSQKVALDQYVMQGGKLMVVMDAADIRKDSLQSGQTFGLQRELNLNDLMFKYGVRLNQNAIQDLNCTKTIVQTGLQGEMQALDFPYYPIIYKFSSHPIVKNLDAIVLRLAGSIDTVKAEGVKKTVLLQTSEQSKVQQVPFQIDLDMLRKNSAPETFTQRNLIAGVLLEGTFQSLYKNRMASQPSLLGSSKPTKIVVFSDADLVKNEYNAKLHKAIPLGFDKDLNYQFSNKDLLMNAVDYLLQESFISVRTTEVKLRPLNKNKVRDEKEFWKFLNILLPIVTLVGFGVVRYRWRKNKYGKKQ